MFASFIQIVTLVAFTAHAVLGCCWHHSHTTIACSTQAAAEGQPDHSPAQTSVDDCSQRSSMRTHTNCSHQHAAKVCDAAQDRSGRLVKPSCCSSSHQPADHCTYSRCTYISAKLLTFNLSDAASPEGFVATCDLLRLLTTVHAEAQIAHRPSFSSPQSSGERCAYLQTWQI